MGHSKEVRGLGDFSSLLESGEWSDFKLICEGESFALHKNIVCLQSPVIAAALRGPFEVHPSLESSIDTSNMEC